MNIEVYQHHSSPQGAGGEELEMTLNSAPMFDLDRILSEVHHGAFLKMHAAPPKSAKDLMTEVRAKHGSKEAHLKKAHTVMIQSLLSEIREHKKHHSLKHLTCGKRSHQQLISTIRACRGGDLLMQIRAPFRKEHLRKVTTRCYQDVLTMIRAGHELERLDHVRTACRQALLSEIRAAHGGKGLLQKYKSIMNQIAHFNPANLKKATTVTKQSLLSQVRAEHGIYDNLHVLKKSTTHLLKSDQYLMSEVRSAHGGKMRLKKSATVERQSLLSQVRSTHRRMA